MISFSGYWTTAEFIDRYGKIGWVEEPRKRTWDTTRRWNQVWTWSGPTSTTKTFLGLLAQSSQPTSKAFQVVCASDGPISKVSAVWYSDDFDGVVVRDALITTWSMGKNVGSQSILFSPKSLSLFAPVGSNLLTRIAQAAQGYKLAIASQQQALATTGRRPTKSPTKLLNDFFKDFVVEDLETGAEFSDIAGNKALQWQAAQLYRMICRERTSAPFSQYVLTKTQVCFPSAVIESGAQIGGGVKASYDRVFYAFSTKALLETETELNDQFASLLSVGQFPIMWWIKQPPDVQQTSDSRWQIVQHWYAAIQFEPYITPWVRSPSETFNLVGQFDPSTWSDAPTSTEPYTTKQYGVKDGTCKQWSADLQKAIFGSNQTYQDLI